jgi:hypothetical protein
MRGLKFLLEITNFALVNTSERAFPFVLLFLCDLGSATETLVVIARNLTEEVYEKVSEQACLENKRSENYNLFKGVNELINYCPYFLNDMGKFLYRSTHNALKHMYVSCKLMQQKIHF